MSFRLSSFQTCKFGLLLTSLALSSPQLSAGSMPWLEKEVGHADFFVATSATRSRCLWPVICFFFVWPSPYRSEWCIFFCDPSHKHHDMRAPTLLKIWGGANGDVNLCCDRLSQFMVFRCAWWSVIFAYSFRAAWHLFRSHPENFDKGLWLDLPPEQHRLNAAELLNA